MLGIVDKVAPIAKATENAIAVRARTRVGEPSGDIR